MGVRGLLSRLWLRTHIKAYNLQAIETVLNTGDIVLLSLAQAGHDHKLTSNCTLAILERGVQEVVVNPGDNYTYLTRIGSWHGITHIGFLVRKGLGPDSLLLCHADRPPHDDFENPQVQSVTITRFREEISSGLYNLVVVRQLAKPLTDLECEAVEQYVNQWASAMGDPAEAPGGKAPRETTGGMKANILMKAVQGHGLFSACSSINRDYERFFCSQFVAGMLQVAGRVVLIGQEYVPTPADWPAYRGMVFGRPMLVRLQDPGKATETSSDTTIQRKGRIRLPRRLVRSSISFPLTRRTPERASVLTSSNRSDKEPLPVDCTPPAPNTASPQEGRRGRTRSRSHSRSSSGSSITLQAGMAGSPTPSRRSLSGGTAQPPGEISILPTVLSGRSANFGAGSVRTAVEDSEFVTPPVNRRRSSSVGAAPQNDDSLGGESRARFQGADRVSGELQSAEIGRVPPPTFDLGEGGRTPVTKLEGSSEDCQQSALYRASMGVVSIANSALTGFKDLLKSSSFDSPSESGGSHVTPKGGGSDRS